MRQPEGPLYTTSYCRDAPRDIPDLCPSSRTSGSFDKGQPAPANTPHLLRWCPLTQSPNPFSRHPCIGGGSSRGEGCQPPYFIRSSSFTYYRHSSFKGFLRVPILRSTSLRGILSVFFYSLVILYQNVLQMSRQ